MPKPSIDQLLAHLIAKDGTPHTTPEEDKQLPTEPASPSTSEWNITSSPASSPHHKAQVSQIQIQMTAPVTSLQYQLQVINNWNPTYQLITMKPFWRSYTVTNK